MGLRVCNRYASADLYVLPSRVCDVSHPVAGQGAKTDNLAASRPGFGPRAPLGRARFLALWMPVSFSSTEDERALLASRFEQNRKSHWLVGKAAFQRCSWLCVALRRAHSRRPRTTSKRGSNPPGHRTRITSSTASTRLPPRSVARSMIGPVDPGILAASRVDHHPAHGGPRLLFDGSSMTSIACYLDVTHRVRTGQDSRQRD